MSDLFAFINYKRQIPEKRPVAERIQDFTEFYLQPSTLVIQQQAARCMGCGVPFCHDACPLGNLVPEFNEAVARNDWHAAYLALSRTNDFPEITGRVCPAPCEPACVLGVTQEPVTIKWNERHIIERAFQEGWVKPDIPAVRTGNNIAVIGSGPAGLAAACQLNRFGHSVTVYEKHDKIGGLLRYGIPDFKLEKWIIDRRLDIMKQSGIKFITNAEVGTTIPVSEVQAQSDAVLLTGGATIARELQLPGRDLYGIHLAMEYLEQKNRQIDGQSLPTGSLITAKGKHVVVIGGGDTGADCVGTANREQASSVTQFEILPKPPGSRHPDTPWPNWPLQLRTSTSHEEGCERRWSIMSREFVGDAEGRVTGIKIVDVSWSGSAFVAQEATERIIPCDLALIAIGFERPQKKGLLDQLAVRLDDRGNVLTSDHQTSVPGVFAAGDMRTGQSLVVTALSEGRQAARAINQWLT